MNQPSSLNASTGFDLEEYERKMLSASKSFSAIYMLKPGRNLFRGKFCISD